MGTDMKLRNIVLGSVMVTLLAGCGVFSSKKKLDYKAGAEQAQPLEVPPDLTTPEAGTRNTIPGTDGEKVASYSEYAKKGGEQPCEMPAGAEPDARPDGAAAKLQERDGSKSILLAEPFDRSWRRVGLALERARFKVTDKDRSKGIYFVLPASDKKQSKGKKPSDYQVTVRENGAGSEVAVVDQNGKSDAESVRLVEALFQNLNQENGPGDEIRPAR